MMPITLGNIAPVNSERNAFVCRPRLLGSSIERLESLGTWKCLPPPTAAFMVPCSLRPHLSISSTFLLLCCQVSPFYWVHTRCPSCLDAETPLASIMGTIHISCRKRGHYSSHSWQPGVWILQKLVTDQQSALLQSRQSRHVSIPLSWLRLSRA